MRAIIGMEGVYDGALPVDGALDGLKALKSLGNVRLVVVTARSEDSRASSQKWLDDKFPGGADFSSSRSQPVWALR